MPPAQPSPMDLDLAKCFAGEQQLVSWETAYDALCEPDTATKSAILADFLKAEDSVHTLSRPWKPFSPPSPEAKNKFDSITAPINVSPSQSGLYNLDEIKEDSLWLAKEANISETAALRLVVQEWQSRPTIQLLSGLTEEEAVSVREASGLSNHGASAFVPNASVLGTPSGLALQTDAQFESSEQRKLRIIDIYLSTCVAILRISQLLVSWGAAEGLRKQGIYGPDYRVCHDWLELLGKAIANQQEAGQSGLDQCIRAVGERLDTLEAGFQWSVPESIEEVAAQRWTTAQTVELVHMLHLTLTHADLIAKNYVPSSTIEDWFVCVAQRAFLCEFPQVTPDQGPYIPLTQLFTSLVTCAILKVDSLLEDIETGNFTEWPSSLYVLDGGVIERITRCFGEAKRIGPSPATPPAFSWAILTWRLCEIATALEQEQQHSAESPSASRRSLTATSPVEDAVQSLMSTNNDLYELFDRKQPSQELAETCSAFGVLNIVNNLVSVAMDAFGTLIDRISRDRIRLLFLRLLRASMGSGIVAYSPDLIVCAHTLLTGDRSFRNWTEKDGMSHADPVVAYFHEDKTILHQGLMAQALFRYPYELTPFLKFSSALVRGEKLSHSVLPPIVQTLTSTSRLTQRLPDGFAGYNTTREEENANFIQLLEDLPQFTRGNTPTLQNRRRLLASASLTYGHDSMVIPANTEGNVVDESSQPFVASWEFPHSAIEYLISLLVTYTVGSNTVVFTTQEPATTEDTTEIIGFFADLLHASLKASSANGDDGFCSPELLGALDMGTDRNQDTVSIVLAIFEEELLRLCREPSDEASLELVINCTRFVQALVVIAPNRVWPWLARSQLLESNGNGGSLAKTLIGTEIVLGRYDFLIGCISLFRALVKDAVGRSVARRSPSKALSRFKSASTAESGTSDRIMSSTLLSFARTLASIYGSSLGWRYNRLEDRLEIITSISESFTTILKLAYSIDDAPRVSSKLTRLVAPVAEYIAELYLTKTEDDLPTNPILASLLSGANIDRVSLLTTSAALCKQQTLVTLLFSDTLVRVAMLLNKPWTHLEQQLFKATPLLARLYATNDVWKSPVVSLLESLVRGAVRVVDAENSNGATKNGHQEPPSLLGHLGPRTAKNFLSVLCQLDEPLKIVDVQVHVWNLLSAVVTCKQQWFSLYLLTGSTPRDAIRTKNTTNSPASRNKSLLSRALESLQNLQLERENRPWPLYTAMLEFVSSAQNNWSWAMGDLREHQEFIQQLLKFLQWMAKQPRDMKRDEQIVARAYQNRFASLACEILAMYSHSSRQVGDVAPLKDIVPSVGYLEDNALELPSYNVSLHGNLKQNLERQLPGVLLDNIKRTTLYPESFGKSFFYDTGIADQLLNFNSNWTGPKSGSGLKSDVERANCNLSLVESQVQLLQSWKLLALELSWVVARDERLIRVLTKVVRGCMVANARSNLPEVLFGQLMMLRADLAFVLLKKLAEAKIPSPDARQLLLPIWEAIRSATPDFENVFSSDQVHYYRSLLRILYLGLQFHLVKDTDESSDTALRSSFRGSVPASHKTYTAPISNQLLEMLSDTVAKGFRSLATQLHSDPSTVSPSDFALLTALLQRIMAVPEMAKFQSQSALTFANNNTVRYATSLYSWSDRLTVSDPGFDDPIYGELSVLFILSLTSIQPLAETMAVEGILSQLNTANLMNYFRRPGGMGPMDSPPRLYSIWTKGILPLCLNLLYCVGPAIAGEIASFLNQYQPQLSRASNALNSRTATKMTLSTASETHSLALISSILDAQRAQGPKLGIQASDIAVLEWDRENVKEDIDGWLARKGALRERIVVNDERDAELFAKKKDGKDSDGSENELEERVLKELEAAGICLGLAKGNNGSS